MSITNAINVNNIMKTRQEIYEEANQKFARTLIMSTYLRALFGKGLMSIQNFRQEAWRLSHARENLMSTMFPKPKDQERKVVDADIHVK